MVDRKKGSITVEAAMLIPICLMVLSFCVSILMLHMKMQETLVLLNESVEHAVSLHYGVGAIAEQGPATVDTWLKAHEISAFKIPSFLKAALKDTGQIITEDLMLKTIENDLDGRGISQLQLDVEWKPYGALVAYSYTVKQAFLLPVPPHTQVSGQLVVPTLLSRVKPLKAPPSQWVGVYVTPHGLSKSHKYHTHTCWSLKRAHSKTTYQVSIEDLMDDTLEIEGKLFTVCLICKKEEDELP